MKNIDANTYAVLQKNGMTKKNACYANAFSAVMKGYFDKYILGKVKMASEQIWVRHAWVEKDNVQYDLTLQASGYHINSEYKFLYKLDRRELTNLIINHYGKDNLDRMADQGIGFNPPILDDKDRIVIYEE